MKSTAPRPLPRYSQMTDQEFAKAVRARFRQLTAEAWEGEMVSDQQKQMMEYWKLNRPQMHQRLNRLSLLVPLSRVLEEQALAETNRLIAEEQMTSSDAERRTMHLLMMEPEMEDEDPTALPVQLLNAATTN